MRDHKDAVRKVSLETGGLGLLLPPPTCWRVAQHPMPLFCHLRHNFKFRLIGPLSRVPEGKVSEFRNWLFVTWRRWASFLLLQRCRTGALFAEALPWRRSRHLRSWPLSICLICRRAGMCDIHVCPTLMQMCMGPTEGMVMLTSPGVLVSRSALVSDDNAWQRGYSWCKSQKLSAPRLWLARVPTNPMCDMSHIITP